MTSKPRIWYDMVFLDLPWGGEDYMSRDNVELFLGTTSLKTICRTVLFNKCRFIALKVPSNYDCDSLDRDLVADSWTKRFEYRFFINREKKTYWLFLVYETPKSSQRSSTLSPTVESSVSIQQDSVDQTRVNALIERYWH